MILLLMLDEKYFIPERNHAAGVFIYPNNPLFDHYLVGASRILGNWDKAASLKGDAASLKGDTPRASQSVLKSWTDPIVMTYLGG